MLQRFKCNQYKLYPDLRNYCSDILQLNSKISYLFCSGYLWCVLHSSGHKMYILQLWLFLIQVKIKIFVFVLHSYIDTGTLFFCLHNIFLGCTQVSFMARICCPQNI